MAAQAAHPLRQINESRYLPLRIAAAGVALLISACSDRVDPAHDADNFARFFTTPAQQPASLIDSHAGCDEYYKNRKAWFGGLHVHTGLSFDAFAFGSRATPDEAYRYARGEPIGLPPYDKNGSGSRVVKIDRPLDFLAVTDHAEHLGEHNICLDNQHPAYSTIACRGLRGDFKFPPAFKPLLRLFSFVRYGNNRPLSVCGTDGAECIERARAPWELTQKSAEDWYDRSSNCAFTSFVAYEYSLALDSSNLHRNVIFANAAVPPLPLSSREAEQPQQLWQWLKQQCLDTDTGCDAIAIPHNSNWSNGRMFYPDFDGDRALAALRAQIEPLVEVMQIKGDSECRQGMANVAGTPDEYCDFEKLRSPNENAEDCGDGYGSKGMQLLGCLSRWSYARYGLIEGLNQQRRLGVNPFKFGLLAATDTHIGTAGGDLERSYRGGMGMESTAAQRLRQAVHIPGVAKGSPSDYNPGGVAGIWAEENTRDALFAAMKRRETFGTSGPRITPRLFGGWDFPEDICASEDHAALGYRYGVPMGADLPAMRGNTPVFVASAMRDPSPHGTPLQRLQIIKGWMDKQGIMQQRVYDVAGGDNGASVDLQTCERSGEGHATLCSVWRDPDFHADQSAVYYLRALENPVCRWSTRQCNDFVAGAAPAGCSEIPASRKVIQERAWSSPIWYTATDG